MTAEEWFSAVLLLEANHPDESDYDDPLFERRVVSLKARSEAGAMAKATTLCGGLREDYRNAFDKRVQWRCTSVEAVTPLYVSAIEDGSEVYSEFLSSRDRL